MRSRGAMGENSAESAKGKEREPMVVNDDHDDISPSGHSFASGDSMTEVGNAGEILTRMELDLAYCSEKLLNLDILLMHVASRLSDYESLDMENSSISSVAAKKAFEFDTLSGILDSEIKELDNYMSCVQTEIVGFRQRILPSDQLFKAFEIKKLQDAERSLKQSQEQVAEIRIQSTKFERTLALRRKEIWNGEADHLSETGHFSTNDGWKMQTVEQQRHILQMLEQSLAREIDLEKELSDSLNNVGIKSKLHLLEWEDCCIGEPTEAIRETGNVSEVLLEISKELMMSKQQSAESSSNGSVQWEKEMRSKLQGSMLKLSAEELENFLVQQANSFRDHLKDAEDKYTRANSETLMLKEKMNSLEEKLRESDIQLQQARNAIEASEVERNMLHSELTELANLQRNIVKAESAEAKCTLLSKTTSELNQKGCFLRSSLAEKVNLLESKLKESDAQLEHANAFAKAIEQERKLLCDRKTLTEDLKAKVFEAQIRAKSAASKCTLLTKTNLQLNKKLRFLRSRVEFLERSLNQADEMRSPNPKDISNKTEIVTYLVMRLVLERECLQAQMSGLIGNEAFQGSRQRKDNVHATSSHGNKDEEEFSFIDPFKESILRTSITNFQVENSVASVGRTEMDPTTSVDGEIDAVTKAENVKSIEIKQVNSKNVFISSLVMVLSVCGMYIFQLKCSLH